MPISHGSKGLSDNLSQYLLLSKTPDFGLAGLPGGATREATSI